MVDAFRRWGPAPRGASPAGGPRRTPGRRRGRFAESVAAFAGPALLLLLAVAVFAQAPRGDWTEWRVRSVRCLGLQVTDSTTILRELELLPGTGYDDRLLDADANAIKNTNLFARLVVSVKADSADESVDIVYAVTERPPWFAYPILSPSVGAGNRVDLVYGFGLMHRNLGGLGRRLDLEAEYGAHLNYSLTYVEPWFLGRRHPLSFHAARRVDDSANGDYSRSTRSLGFGVSHYYQREFSVGLQPFWQEVRVRDHRPVPEQVTVNPLGLDVYGGLTLSADLNLTDLHVNPTRGWRSSVSLMGFGSGGDRQPAGLAGELETAGYRRFASGVLALHLATGWTGGRRGDYMKRYLGGSLRVRAGEGGDWPGWSTALGTLEWRRTLLEKRIIFRRYDVGLGGVLFVDGGLVWPELYGGTPLAAGGAGVGLRLFAPFIEVGRLDLAWSPERGLQVRIGRGQAF